MNKRTKSVIAIVTIIVIIGIVIGGLMWNKGPQDIKDAIAIKISAVGLYNNFMLDSVSAKTKYINKIVEVSGEVKESMPNGQQQLVVLLKTNKPDASINCTMEDKTANIQPGTTVVIKGICNGLNGDADMGIPMDVVMDRCYIIN